MILLDNKIKDYIVLWFAFVFVSFFVVSCNFAYSPSTETKSNTATVGKNQRSVIYSAKYEVQAQASIIKCKGDGLVAELYSDYTLELKGLAKCGIGGDLNISDYTKEPAEEVDDTPYRDSEYNGLVIRALNPQKDASGSVPEGYAYFYPPRPNIVNPVLREKKLKKYVGKTLEEDSEVTIGLANGTSLTDNGKIIITIHSLDSAPPSDVKASVAPLKKGGKVVVFTIGTSGFSGVEKKGSYMLFDSLKIWMGTNPIALYKMEIKSKVKDVASIQDIREKTDSNPLLKTLSGLGVLGTILSSTVNRVASNALEKQLDITARIIENISLGDDSDEDEDEDEEEDEDEDDD